MGAIAARRCHVWVESKRRRTVLPDGVDLATAWTVSTHRYVRSDPPLARPFLTPSTSKQLDVTGPLGAVGGSVKAIFD